MGDVTTPQAPPAKGPKGQSFLRDRLRRLIRERPVGAVSAAILLLLCLVAIFADLLAPFHFMDMTLPPTNPATPPISSDTTTLKVVAANPTAAPIIIIYSITIGWAIIAEASLRHDAEP